MKIIILFLAITAAIFSQEVQTPLEKNNFDSLTSYSQMITFLNNISKADKRIKLEYIAEIS